MKKVRVGTGTAFWGDSLDGAFMAVEKGDINYLGSDHLAELTMCICHKLKRRNPKEGYTKDIVPLMTKALPICVKKGIKVIDNGGGANPEAATERVIEIAKELGLKGLKVATVIGDDITDRIEELRGKGVTFDHMDTGESIEKIKDRLVNASVYLGSPPIVDALKQGADVVMTGRGSDLSLFVAPMMYEFGWKEDEWDLLAAGSLLAHAMECGGQAVGGNYAFGWKDVPEPWNLSFPIGDSYENGEMVITHVDGMGGVVTIQSVTEQLIYETHDPKNYLTPDVTVDFTGIKLEEVAKNRVKMTGIKGKPRPQNLKAGIGYTDGFMGEGRCMYSWPDAVDKAKRGAEIVLKRLEKVGVKPDEVRVDYIGMNALWGSAAPQPECEPNEVELRIAIKTKTAAEAGLLGREMVALGTIGPPGMGGYTSPGKPRELMAWWPVLVPREEVKPQVIMKEVK